MAAQNQGYQILNTVMHHSFLIWLSWDYRTWATEHEPYAKCLLWVWLKDKISTRLDEMLRSIEEYSISVKQGKQLLHRLCRALSPATTQHHACERNIKLFCFPEAAEEVGRELACQASRCACTALDDAESVALGPEVFWPLAKLCNRKHCWLVVITEHALASPSTAYRKTSERTHHSTAWLCCPLAKPSWGSSGSSACSQLPSAITQRKG